MEELKAILKGRVQGVGFRYFTVKEAERLGLKGYVKNLPGGEVEIVAQGDKDSLKKLVSRVKEGPSAAVVKDVNTNYRPLQREYAGFNVKY
jgi:acylphosphatase